MKFRITSVRRRTKMGMCKNIEEKKRARLLTRRIIQGKNLGIIYLLPTGFLKCKKCGVEKKLTIHHEEYPKRERDIIISIRKGKIYMLCKKCHKELDKYCYKNKRWHSPKA